MRKVSSAPDKHFHWYILVHRYNEMERFELIEDSNASHESRVGRVGRALGNKVDTSGSLLLQQDIHTFI
jgi:hypothetical protein